MLNPSLFDLHAGMLALDALPSISNRELVERLIESRPGMRSLLMSGYTDDDILRRGVLHGETAFLQKPFTPEQLARKLRGVLDRS